MLSWFKKKQDQVISPLKVDIHSHLLPGLDDGVKSFEESIEIIRHFQTLGYSELITTPHIMSDLYRNDATSINDKLDELKRVLQHEGMSIKINAAAEYYLDESLIQLLEKDEPLLTIKGRYLLFETNFLNEPLNLKEFIFLASTKGYKLILAHPERYLYLHENLAKAEDLLNRGVLFQINISSLTGYYAKESQAMAFKFIDRGWIHWLGSDCHHLKHVQLVKEVQKNKYFQKALTLPLLNNTLQ